MADRDTQNAFDYLNDLNELLVRLTDAELIARQAELDVQALGARARALGASWSELGDSLAITRQSAIARWGHEKGGAGRSAQLKRLLKLKTKKYGRLSLAANMEFERRFLVLDPSIVEGRKAYDIEQAYLWSSSDGYAIRIRDVTAYDALGRRIPTQPTLTLKGPKGGNGGRVEEEMKIPGEHARTIIDGCRQIIRKRRYVIRDDDSVWEVDEFRDNNAGLLIAEYEGTPDQVALIRVPSWCGKEITHDHRYNNEQLARHPWRSWADIKDPANKEDIK